MLHVLVSQLPPRAQLDEPCIETAYTRIIGITAAHHCEYNVHVLHTECACSSLWWLKWFDCTFCSVFGEVPFRIGNCCGTNARKLAYTALVINSLPSAG